jgi:hypothetical protein
MAKKTRPPMTPPIMAAIRLEEARDDATVGELYYDLLEGSGTRVNMTINVPSRVSTTSVIVLIELSFGAKEYRTHVGDIAGDPLVDVGEAPVEDAGDIPL